MQGGCLGWMDDPHIAIFLLLGIGTMGVPKDIGQHSVSTWWIHLLTSIYVSKVFSTHLWNTPLNLLPPGYEGIPFIVGLGDCLGCALRVCCNFLGMEVTEVTKREVKRCQKSRPGSHSQLSHNHDTRFFISIFTPLKTKVCSFMEHVFFETKQRYHKIYPFGCPVIFKHWCCIKVLSFVSSSHCFIISPAVWFLRWFPRRDVKDVFLGLDSTGEGTISLSDARLLEKDVVDGILLKGHVFVYFVGKGVVGTVKRMLHFYVYKSWWIMNYVYDVFFLVFF